MVEAIILAGGLGTRLAETVPNLPKALAPIQGIPFLQLLLKQLEKSSMISKAILALGHKAQNIQDFIQSQMTTSYPVEFSIETTPLGTGGALLHALSKTTSETLLVLNGDSYFDLSFPHFFSFHKNMNSDISIACKQVADISRYGAVEIAPSLQICAFCEKTPVSKSGWISGGIYLIQRSILSSFSPGVCSLEKELFPRFLHRNLFAYCQNGSFIDIGTPNSYNEAQEILKTWIPL